MSTSSSSSATQIEEKEMFMNLHEFEQIMKEYEQLKLFKTDHKQTEDFIEKNKEKYMAQYINSINDDTEYDYYVMDDAQKNKKLVIKITEI